MKSEAAGSAERRPVTAASLQRRDPEALPASPVRRSASTPTDRKATTELKELTEMTETN